VTKKLTLLPDRHPDDDAFENYAFDRLSANDLAAFEEHLLICENCQRRLERTDEYIRLMKAATAAYITEHPERPPAKLRERGLRWNAAAAAVLLLTCLTALLSWRTPSGEPRVVVLDAYRGVASEAPAGKPLDLKIDLKDVPPAAAYRVEIVDATGRRVWFGGTPARLTKGLSPGVYWARLSTDAGEPLREYGLIATKVK
jgi:hypothetical protein